ncbi:MAG: hypothetical protein ABUS49_10145 [Acidobacteriota bacterium]
MRPLLGDLVFVGGSVTGLLVTDEAAGDPRAARDVDAIAEIRSYAAYTSFGERLRSLGFAEDTSEDAPLCRRVCREIVLDVMPADGNVLGFSNRWYRAAIETAGSWQLAEEPDVRIVTAPLFVCYKIRSFQGKRER